MVSGWSIALLLASCLVSKGVGVDGLQDSLTVVVQGSRSDVDVKKKVKGWRVTGLTRQTNRQDNNVFVAQSKARYRK